MDDAAAHVVSVEILGQRYPIKAALDPAYLAGLASYVDDKIRSAAEALPGGDAVRVAVVAALNIADELFRCRDAQRDWAQGLVSRAVELEALLDTALAE